MGDSDTDERVEEAPLRVLFFLRAIHYGRVFENFLRALLERGHVVHVALAVQKRGLGDDRHDLFDELEERYAFTYEQLPPRREPWLRPAVALRHGIDYLRYLEPAYRDAEPLRKRSRERAPGIVHALTVFPFRGRVGRSLLGRALRALESAMPISKELARVVRKRAPDVVLVAPLVGLGSIESDAMRAAQAAGVPTVLPVASWDNLTNKGVLRETPTLTVVWNETQVEEAVTLHKLPRDRVVAVGAHAFDHWFAWEPATTREEFAARAGLDPDRPLVLYLGSSHFIAGDETGFAKEWIARVRSDPRLADAAIMLRPHPQNRVGWAEVEDVPGLTAVWPRGESLPNDPARKAEYYDSLFHASAVVGINTSGLIEASIVGRPVLTLVSDYFETQEGTLHFASLAHGDGGGVVTVGRDWDEHLAQLAEAIESPAAYEGRIRSFLTDFVRPAGLEIPAAPAAVDAIERAAATNVEPVPPHPRLLAALIRRLTPVLARRYPPRPARELSDAERAKKEARSARRREGKVAIETARPRAKDAAHEALATEQAGERTERATRGKEEARKRKRRSDRVNKARKRLAKLAKRGRRGWKMARRRVGRTYNVRYRALYGRTLARVPSRDEIPALLNRRGLTGTGAEIGVKTGKYSDFLLRNWRGAKLISIDPWLSASPEEYVDRSNVAQDEFETYFRTTTEKLGTYGARSEIWRLTSVEAAARVPDGSLDFAYIDARHDYASVLEDLAAWYPKMRPGAILAGHDYADGHFANGDFGVKSAVDEFFAARGLQVYSTDGPSAVEMFPSWIVEIPANGAGANGTADRA